ncbi:RNA-binding protein FUS-like [Watersipora subatra]|uniref:RNA-binding protein FUS-like n=1 Tax=Watersipora subatra TaxID=2589382 RepID=UPI00355C5A88
MSCGGGGSVNIANTSGCSYDCSVQKWCKGFFGWKWKTVYIKVFRDSEVAWFNSKGESKAIGKVVLKSVAQFLAVGPYADKMPGRPELPSGGKVEYMLAFPDHPSRTSRVNWLIVASDRELGQLMNAFCSVLPRPQRQKPPPIQQARGVDAPPPYGSTVPPPYQQQRPPANTLSQLGGPPPQQGGYRQPAPAGYPQQQTGYRQQAPQQPGTTVIVQGQQGGHRNNSDDGFVTGMMMGAMISGGYGPCWGWGYAPGWGYGGWGYHSHFDSHMHNSTEINNTYVTNETNNITNNYNEDQNGGEEDGGQEGGQEEGGQEDGGQENGGQEEVADYNGYGQGDGYNDQPTEGANEGGYDQGGYDQGGYNQPEYDLLPQNQADYYQGPFNQAAYDQSGFNDDSGEELGGDDFGGDDFGGDDFGGDDF